MMALRTEFHNLDLLEMVMTIDNIAKSLAELSLTAEAPASGWSPDNRRNVVVNHLTEASAFLNSLDETIYESANEARWKLIGERLTDEEVQMIANHRGEIPF